MIKLTLEDLKKRVDQHILKGLYWIDEDDYHSGPGISSTDIKTLLKSPAHYKAHKATKKDSPAMAFGRALHCLFLEPEKFSKSYIVRPNFGNAQLKKVKEEIKAWEEETFHKYHGIGNFNEISIKDSMKIREMIAVYQETPRYHQIHNNATCELSAYAMDKDTAVLKKARADLIQGPTIFDLKTTDDARPDAFVRTILRYGYHISAAYYLDTFSEAGQEVDSFVWIAIEKEPPYGVRLYVASESMISIGRKKYKQALKLFRESEKSGIWRAYESDFEAIDFPDYLIRKSELENDE